ncbi:MAG: NAD(P)-dependent oxidoreductase [Hyphomicrobiaceae bacterium]
MRIGTVGLGAMGAPMTRNLCAGGDEVYCYDIDPAKSAALVGGAIHAVDSVAEMAATCELVVIMITNDNALRKVVFGPKGLLAGKPRGCAVDLSTTSVTLARDCEKAVAAAGATFLDGAVIGGGAPAAKAGKSPIVVSGDSAAYEKIKDKLARLGSCDFVGACGNAKIVKTINNMLVGIITASNAEALALGMAAGMDLKSLVEGLESGSGGSVVLKSYMGKYANEGVYGDGLIGNELMAKDMTLACDLGKMTDSPVLFAELARQFYMLAGKSVGQEKMFPSVFELFGPKA